MQKRKEQIEKKATAIDTSTEGGQQATYKKETKKKKRFKDNFFMDPQGTFLSNFDTFMLIVIAYSCFTSAYYVAFEFPTDPILLGLEHCVFVFFTLEIIFKCVSVSPNADESERSHLKIIKKYMRNGTFFMDFAATFPFYLIESGSEQEDPTAESEGSYSVLLKLLRMVRIPKILNLLNIDRLLPKISVLLDGLSRKQRVEKQRDVKNLFKVLRLTFLTVIITYFTACLFYFISSAQDMTGLNFLTYNSMADEQYSKFYKFITVCYYSITTLSTVGYGDLFPISNLEKIMGIYIMLGGVGFFSYVMSAFIEIISTLNKTNTAD